MIRNWVTHPRVQFLRRIPPPLNVFLSPAKHVLRFSHTAPLFSTPFCRARPRSRRTRGWTGLRLGATRTLPRGTRISGSPLWARTSPVRTGAGAASPPTHPPFSPHRAPFCSPQTAAPSPTDRPVQPYQTGIFQVKVQATEQFFQKEAPHIAFLTRVWHPFVDYESVRVCVWGGRAPPPRPRLAPALPHLNPPSPTPLTALRRGRCATSFGRTFTSRWPPTPPR
jgi:hypothetical protein